MLTIAEVIRNADDKKKRRMACRWAEACMNRAQVTDLRSWRAYQVMLRYSEGKATEAERTRAEVLAWEAHWGAPEENPVTYMVALLCGSDAELSATEVADAAVEIIGWKRLADITW